MEESGHLELLLGKKAKPTPYTLNLPQSTTAVPQSTAVCLLHGAGGDHRSGHLPAIAAACAGAGVPCLRFTCRGGNLQHRIAVCEAVLDRAAAELPALRHVDRWIMAGHSMGGRVACAVACSTSSVLGCILLSYPLHPPGRTDELRDALLTAVQQPLLLVRGTKDPFSKDEQWGAVLPRLRSRAWLQHSVEGGDHALKLGGAGAANRSQQALQDVSAAVHGFIQSVLAGNEEGSLGSVDRVGGAAASKGGPKPAKPKPAAGGKRRQAERPKAVGTSKRRRQQA
jgi:predicted alpha/beta-hydrolase family hydrolase